MKIGMQEFPLSQQSKDFTQGETMDMSVHSSSDRKKYGNLIVLFENDRYLITIGPNYICFLLAFVVFAVLYWFTIAQVLQYSTNVWLRGVTIGGAILQLLIYLLLVISNPGITTSVDFDTESEQEVKRFCKICNLPMLPRSRHCHECDVCIKGYDHHCPWTTKCIGQNNLMRFYIFACYTPLFICYCIVVLALAGQPR